MSKTHMDQNGSSPQVSVLLPVYNGEKFLAEAISSILCQTFSDFEFIIINDGSTDKSLEIISQFQDPRIHLVSRENRGLIESLNEGISIATGKWLARMDADDLALSNRFERQLEWLDKTNADICGSWVKRFGEGDERIVRLKEGDSEIKTELLFYSAFVHPAVMICTAKLKQLGYNDHSEKAEDYDLWVRAVEHGLKMTNVPEVLLLYRVHPEQISVEHIEAQLIQTNRIRCKYWHSFFNARKISHENVEEGLHIFVTPRSNERLIRAEELFETLLLECTDIVKTIAMTHIRKLYLLSAADCSNVVKSWRRLNLRLEMESSTAMIVKLLLFRLFQIKEKSVVYTIIRKIYIWKKSKFNI